MSESCAATLGSLGNWCQNCYVTRMDEKPDPLTLVSYLIAAAILLPIGWWLKTNYSGEVGYYILSMGGLLY